MKAHRCMRCQQEFPCPTPSSCTALVDVLPRVGIGDGVFVDHCSPWFGHEGYAGRAFYDFDANVYHGEVARLNDVVTFESATFEGVEQAFRDSVDDYRAMLAASLANTNPSVNSLSCVVVEEKS